MPTPEILPPSPPSTSPRKKPLRSHASVNLTSTPDSPVSFPGSSHGGTRKRVEFSPWTNAHEPMPNSLPSSGAKLKTNPPSSACQSSLKSILKPAPINEEMLQAAHKEPDADRSMGDMMESIVQQLSQDDRSVSVDAYQTLSSVIREYDDVPDEAALKSKIHNILKYIKRDLLRQGKPDEPHIADINLVTQALKVLVIFAWSRDYSSLLSDEYRIFILDRSIQVIAEHTAPKSVIIHYLHLLATQEFRSGLINSNNRVPRLLESLKVLTDHVKGNGAVSERLLVYQKLLDQARTTMKTRANLWVEELLTGMTSALKDIRAKAVTLGTKACSAFPASSSISGSVRTILEKELEPEKTFGMAMCRRLEKMITAKEEMIQVPQIWAIVLLLSYGPETHIDRWPELKDWLKVIQRCFNCSESALRQQSNMAWNRLVYVVRPHEAPDHLMTILAKPLSAQLERQSAEKTVKGSRATAVSSYCNLLYYAFRPAATHKQYTRVWNEYIVKVMRSSFFEKNPANSDVACRVLMSLLWNSNQSTKVWNENRALENTPIEPEELPTMDCKWIRAKSAAIVDMFRVLLRYSSWGASGQSDRAYIAVAWTHFLKALRKASSKEIKPSSETKLALITVNRFLGHLWAEIYEEPDRTDDQACLLSSVQIRQMTRSAVSELGYIPILTGLENEMAAIRQTFILLETFDSIVSDLNHARDHGDMRRHLHNPRSTFQTSLSQYEKCLELLGSSMMEVLQSELTSRMSALTAVIGTLDHVLQIAPHQQLAPTLKLLSKALVVLLKDESRLFMNPADSEDGQIYRSIVNTTVNILAKIPAASLRELDQVFAAPFESSHVSVVNDAVDMWNNHFGQQQSITLGPCLLDALLKLRNFADIDIPGVPQPAQSRTDRVGFPPAAWEEALSPGLLRNVSSSSSQLEQAGFASPILGSHDVWARVEERDHVLPTSPERPVSRPRSRHDDSQIHFVAIESSSPPQHELESQFLTVHQKEVRDRRRSEPAVVFPDLRSSPRVHSKSQNHGDCEFARKAAALVERPSTPTLPTNHDHGEPETMASPTPRARHFTNQIMDIEVPSSPPSMAEKDNAGGENTSSPLRGHAEDAHIGIDLAISQSTDRLEQSTTDVNEPEIEAPFARDLPQDEPAEVKEADIHVQANTDEIELKKVLPVGTFPNLEADELAPFLMGEPEITLNAEDDDDNSGPNSKPRMDSDEIDMLSASQLSQDLDRHIGEVVDAAECQKEMDDITSSQQELQHDRQEPKPPSRNLRKRKSSSFTFTSTKRKRSKGLFQASSDSIEPETWPGVHNRVGEMCDIIEVAPSRAAEAVVASGFAEAREQVAIEPTSPPKHRRERPRRHARNSQSQEHRQQDVGPVIGTSRSDHADCKEESTAQTGGLDANPEENLTMEAEEHKPEGERMMNTGVTADIEGVEQPDGSNTAPEVPTEGPVQPDVVSSLQGILDRLRSTNPGDIDLRSVDDLCFQIRFQAQVISQQRVV
ncbi:uncharacterized protein Z518_04546 [Rhinocladiella mackenziei CBS 650.93]|uniref:Telomere-associated protein Rif1 N-terminal domain-containing protein n=1 Tax=Rhinocladiella mackenziei CBS 650.93 TaxID=1442369 RepID=A0A0D2JBV0_9EURO|nr:uncharacterized protein Z518_04546 [Rhinocladiella mackenziei CBS 650.93]KIX06570.1 hypothetical protein Z518_04546 [Rhinocladiella mackenziei CBS 650.93]